jgi:D-alanyl-D-alanine carboxypeptidase
VAALTAADSGKGPDAAPAANAQPAQPARTGEGPAPPATPQNPEIQARLMPLSDARPKAPEGPTAAVSPASQVENHESGAAQAGWMIQIGATDDLAKANALMTRARAQNRSTLALAKPVTEIVRKGQETYYRVRFAVLDPASAQAACRSLKRNGFSCFAAHD